MPDTVETSAGAAVPITDPLAVETVAEADDAGGCR